MASGRKKPPMQIGQIWEGRSKVGSPFTRRRITAVSESHIEWEIAGSCFRGPLAGSATVASWLSWAKLQVMR